MDKNKVRTAIELFEWYKNGFNSLCGIEVTARNLKLRKDKAVADIVIRWLKEGKQERYNKCEYPYTILKLKNV